MLILLVLLEELMEENVFYKQLKLLGYLVVQYFRACNTLMKEQTTAIVLHCYKEGKTKNTKVDSFFFFLFMTCLFGRSFQ